MNFNQYTKKSLEAVQSAQSLAVEHHHQQMEQLHLLLALLQQEGGLAPQILRKLGVTVESLEAAAQAELDKLPRVSGSREADKFYISQGVDDVLQLAERLAASMKDEYVSVEHFLLALVEAAQGPVKELLGTYRISKEDCLQALQAIRGNQRVTHLRLYRLPGAGDADRAGPGGLHHGPLGPGAPGQGEKDGPGHWPG